MEDYPHLPMTHDQIGFALTESDRQQARMVLEDGLAEERARTRSTCSNNRFYGSQAGILLRMGGLHGDSEFLLHEEVLWKQIRVMAHRCSCSCVLLEIDEAKDQ